MAAKQPEQHPPCLNDASLHPPPTKTRLPKEAEKRQQNAETKRET
jgi:hypothetical protein